MSRTSRVTAKRPHGDSASAGSAGSKRKADDYSAHYVQFLQTNDHGHEADMVQSLETATSGSMYAKWYLIVGSASPATQTRHTREKAIYQEA